MERQEIFLQGHRGCRGYYPENSLSAFKHAISLGVDAIELDVVISQDKKVIIAHEPYMPADLCLTPDDKRISAAEEKSYNLYKMSAAEIARWSYGTLEYEKFPQQKKVKSHRLELAEMMRLLDETTLDYHPQLTIELKSHPNGDDLFHPKPNQYAAMILQAIDQLPEHWPVALQSFDLRIIKALDALQSPFPLIVLNDNKKLEIEDICDDLKFVPEGYGLHHTLIDEETVEACLSLGVELSAWTVNDLKETERLFGLGVRNIITDYPELFV